MLNTSSLSRYLQGKDVDVLAAKRTADLTLAVLEKCRNDKNFSLLWMKTESLADEIQQWLEESEFTYKEITGPRRKPSRRHQALVGEKWETETWLLQTQPNTIKWTHTLYL